MIEPAGLVQLLIESGKQESDAIFWADRILTLDRPEELDLNDPATENRVADAIRRLAPEAAYVPLSVRYPWRFSDHFEQKTTIVDALVEALRGSAAVHEAERIPHLVSPLLALAEALEHGALVPGPPPGRCGNVAPGGLPSLSCDLRAGHTGQHETEWNSGSAYWTGEAS